MFQFSSMAKNASEDYEAFQFARTWAGEFHGLVTFIDEDVGATHTWVEFEKTELYFPHFRIGDACLGAECLIEILVDLGIEQAVAEEEVRARGKYLSVTRSKVLVIDTVTGAEEEKEGFKVSRRPMQNEPVPRPFRTAS